MMGAQGVPSDADSLRIRRLGGLQPAKDRGRRKEERERVGGAGLERIGIHRRDRCAERIEHGLQLEQRAHERVAGWELWLAQLDLGAYPPSVFVIHLRLPPG